VDIGATEYVHSLLLKEREEGNAILLISEDLDEVMALSDRIAVIFEGKIMDVVDADEATPEQLGLLMAGVEEGQEGSCSLQTAVLSPLVRQTRSSRMALSAWMER
jgi:simple sugar transport system ATP-binding protein